MIENGQHYLDELRHDEQGNKIEQHHQVMQDDRNSNTITQSRKQNLGRHHQWKAKEYKDMPKGKSLSSPTDEEEADR